ncbi:MAG TPA: metal-sulfur cluster assembly factor [Burkholderiaceae bacterium]|nr:metal-sulfur cluster assembly factor [Burkholderiaceae bacterium]
MTPAAPQDADGAAFAFEGDAALRQPIEDALRRVVDPEVALNIVDVGLVYGVAIRDGTVEVRLTMTSAACPVADLIIEEAERELDRALPGDLAIRIELVWDPPWSPERMSERGKRFMGW